MIDEVRAHVAERALAPVDPAAPVERVIDRVIVDRRRDAQEEIPRLLIDRLELGFLEPRADARVDLAAAPSRGGAGSDGFLQALRERRRSRHALRPVTERPVGPDVNLAHLTDRTGRDVLVAEAGLVARVPLVAHLGDDLRVVLGLLRQLPRLFDRPAQRLLHVDVLAEVHRGQGDRRVHVIGRRDDYRVDVFLLLQHLAIVAVLLDLGQLLVDEALQELGLAGRTRSLLVRRQLRRRRLAPATARVGPVALLSALRRRGRRLLLPLLDPRVEQVGVDVAERDDVLAEHGVGVAANPCR